MSVMTAQVPLPVAPVAGGVSIGEAAALVQDADGGRVFLRGELVYAWSGEDVAGRRLAGEVAVTIGPDRDSAPSVGVTQPSAAPPQGQAG